MICVVNVNNEKIIYLLGVPLFYESTNRVAKQRYSTTVRTVVVVGGSLLWRKCFICRLGSVGEYHRSVITIPVLVLFAGF